MVGSSEVKWYPWLTSHYRELIAQYRSERPHHALLLHALPGTGEPLLMEGIGHWLMCQRPNGDKTCGECHGCNLMKAGNHPDWHIMVPEKGKSTLGVEPIRQLTEVLYSHAQQGGAKAVWFPDIECLSEAAANALLKTLEEPPQKTYFLLGCREPSSVLATIRSRCAYYHLACPDEEYSIRWLEHQSPGDRTAQRTALRLTGGAPIAAEQLLEMSAWSQRTALCHAFEQTLSHPSWDLLSLLPELNHDNATERLHWLYTLLLDACKWAQGAGQFIANQDRASLVERLAKRIPVSVLQILAQDCLLCRHELDTVAGVNKELMLTERLCRWERELSSHSVN